jgi:UrcA family protein
LNKTVKTNFVLALGLASAIVALAPICSQAADLDKAVVKYSDLDLNTEAGARTLYHRLTRAADEVCPMDSSTLELHRMYKACVNTALNTAVRNVNRATLSKLYTERTGLMVGTQLSMNVR